MLTTTKEHMVENTAKPYLDYLDKEMTIMGILSAFCVAGAGLVVKQALPIAPVGTDGRLFGPGRPDLYYIGCGLALLIAAAGFFYWQRSLLAWHYGQLSLWSTDPETSGQTLTALLQQSDTWKGWIPYQVGLVLTLGSFGELAGALLPLSKSSESLYVLVVAICALGIAAVIALVRVHRDRVEAIESKRHSRRRLRAARAGVAGQIKDPCRVEP